MESLNRLADFAAAGDTIGARDLMLSGRVWEVDQGTRCILVDPGFITHEVRILDGPHAERLVFVAADFVQNLDATDTGNPLLDRLSEAPEENLKQLHKTAKEFDQRMDEVRAETEGMTFAEILNEYKLTSERKFDVYDQKVSFPIDSKSYADHYAQEENLATHQVQLLAKLTEMTHQSDPDRNQTEEGRVLQQLFDLDTEMVERETEIDHELYPDLPKPTRSRDWSISEHKRLRVKLNHVVSEYIANVTPVDAETQRKADTGGKGTPRNPADLHARDETEFRTWTSTSGKFTTEAAIVSYANGVVTLEKRNGSRVKVPQDKLTHSDRDFIEKWRHDRR